MKEAITWVRAKDVRIGDFVSGCSWPSGPKEVTEVRPDFKVICGSYGCLRPLGADIFLLHARPYSPGKTREDMLSAIEKCISAFLMRREYAYDELADKALQELREAQNAYELGEAIQFTKSEAPQPKEEDCRMGRCDHPKNFAGTCLVWAMKHPIQCDQRR